MPAIDLDAAIEAVEVAMNEADAIAAIRALPPVTADTLGADWMRREAYNSLFKHPGFYRTLGGQNFKAVKLEDAAEGILAIPSPTDEQLDTAALARPKIARMVEVTQRAIARFDGNGMRNWPEVNLIRAALAALKGGE